MKNRNNCGLDAAAVVHDGLSEPELTALASQGLPEKLEKNMSEHMSGMIRHVLTSIGGLMVMMGYTDEMTMATVVGAIMTLVGFVWSWQSK